MSPTQAQSERTTPAAAASCITARAGDLVYFETILYGLIPARLEAFDGDEAELVLTADRPANGSGYLRGDRIHTNILHCVPRAAVFKSALRVRPYALIDRKGREISTFPSPHGS